MTIRFTVEERHLADGGGRPVEAAQNVEFHTFDADNIDDAIRLFIRRNDAELIGNVVKFPGFQALATVRKPTGVYTIQVAPASQGYPRP